MIKNVPRIMIAAPKSGSGKTAVSCALIYALKKRGHNISAFKCGPDYIDPMFHRNVLGVESTNLDSYFCDENALKYVLAENGMEISIIEGVMGYYDGLGGVSTEASAFDIAQKTDTDVILVIDGKGASISMAAEIKGFAEFEKNSRIKGVILNRTSEGIYKLLKDKIEKFTGLNVLGFMPEKKELAFESRHLGLVLPYENKETAEKIAVLGEMAERYIDLDAIEKMANNAKKIKYEEFYSGNKEYKVKIYFDKDESFSFYYKENLYLLKKLGAEIVYFSPLNDEKLPECDGIYMGGGYPEIYAEKLSKNLSMINDIRKKNENKIPVFAECGGFLYLLESLEGAEEKIYEMTGVLKGKGVRGKRLGNFGYITEEFLNDTILGEKGTQIKGHEFHYWQSEGNFEDCISVKPITGKKWFGSFARDNIFAGFGHLYFLSNPKIAENFLKSCIFYKEKINGTL